VERTGDKFGFLDVYSGTVRNLAAVLNSVDGRFGSELIHDPATGEFDVVQGSRTDILFALGLE
jgi:hypothetical protein